jgi:hypothetical protein
VQVPYCRNSLNWKSGRSQFAYYIRSFAKQDKSILKDLASGTFFDTMASAAAENDSVASDVLLDLGAFSSTISKRCGRLRVLDNGKEMLCAASSSASAIRGILAVAAADKSAWQALLWSLDAWLTSAAQKLTSDKSTAEDAVRIVQLTAACRETLRLKDMLDKAGTAAEGSSKTATVAADLALTVVSVCHDAKLAASAVAALPLLEPSAECLRRLCSPRQLAHLIQLMKPSDACHFNSVLSSLLAMGTMHEGLLLQLLAQGGASKACLGYVSVVLDKWADEVQEGLQVTEPKVPMFQLRAWCVCLSL